MLFSLAEGHANHAQYQALRIGTIRGLNTQDHPSTSVALVAKDNNSEVCYPDVPLLESYPQYEFKALRRRNMIRVPAPSESLPAAATGLRTISLHSGRARSNSTRAGGVGHMYVYRSHRQSPTPENGETREIDIFETYCQNRANPDSALSWDVLLLKLKPAQTNRPARAERVRAEFFSQQGTHLQSWTPRALAGHSNSDGEVTLLCRSQRALTTFR